MKTSKAEFLRWLKVGKELRLVNCLLGVCDKPRTVVRVKGMNVELRTEKDSISHLFISPEEHVEKTTLGYKIVMTDSGRICAEYIEK